LLLFLKLAGNNQLQQDLGSDEDPFNLEYAEDRVVESSTVSNHSDQTSTDYFEPLTGVKVHLHPVFASDPNTVVLDQAECVYLNHPVLRVESGA